DVIVSFFLADGQDIQPFHGAIDQFSGAARGAQGDVQHGLHTGASLEWKYEKPEIIAELAQDMQKDHRSQWGVDFSKMQGSSARSAILECPCSITFAWSWSIPVIPATSAAQRGP